MTPKRMRNSLWIAGLYAVVAGALMAAGCTPAAQPAPALAPAPAASAAVPTPTAAPAPTRATPTASPSSAAMATPARPAPFTPTPAVTQVKRGGTLRLINPVEPAHGDPHRTPTIIDMWEYVGNFVINFDPVDGSPVPELAEGWEFKDPQTLVLRIRKGVKFHNSPPANGRELTAEDIVWNLERIRRPGAQYIQKSNLEPVDSITALDKNTVQLKLKFPFAPMVSYLRGTQLPQQPVLAPEVEEKLGGEDAYKNLLNARGTGPFMIKAHTPGVSATAVRNPEYWQQGRPYLDTVQVFIVPDTATMIAAFRTGNVDFGSARAGTLDIVGKTNLEKTNPTIKFSSFSEPYIIGIMPNVTRKPLDDVRLRKAMFLALDRDEALQVNLGGGGHVSGPLSWKLFPGWTWSEEELMKREGYRPKNTPGGQQDIAEAQKIIQELGYGPDKLLTLNAEGCQCFEFINLTSLEVAKSQLQKIWININIRLVDRAQFFDQDASGNFTLRSRGYGAALEPDAQLNTRHHSKGSRNFQKLSDSELDKLLEDQRREVDVVKRRQLVMKAQERLWSLYPQMWLHTREAYLVQQPWVEMRPSGWRLWGDPASTWINR